LFLEVNKQNGTPESCRQVLDIWTLEFEIKTAPRNLSLSNPTSNIITNASLGWEETRLAARLELKCHVTVVLILSRSKGTPASFYNGRRFPGSASSLVGLYSFSAFPFYSLSCPLAQCSSSSITVYQHLVQNFQIIPNK
jgi:hypothetical protein